MFHSVSAEILLSFGVNQLFKKVDSMFHNVDSDLTTGSFSVPGGITDGLDLICLSCWTGVREVGDSVTPGCCFPEATGASVALVCVKTASC